MTLSIHASMEDEPGRGPVSRSSSPFKASRSSGAVAERTGPIGSIGVEGLQAQASNTRQAMPSAGHLLHKPADIAAILRRESARCERTGHEFSLVMADLPQTDRKSLDKLSSLLIDRARNTDEVGYFEKKRLCAVLPDTGADGAAQFVRGLCVRAQEFGLFLNCSIYSYPSAWLSEQANKSGVEKKNSSPMQMEKQNANAISNTTAAPMEPLLAHPMPAWKRAIDVAVAGSALVVLSPLLAAVAILIKRSSPGPVIFKQKRAGLAGAPFWIYKFRTMVPDAERLKAQLRAQSEQDGPAFKIKHDPRITPIGRFLRETSIDELPQLINVLKGDMSLVGPRPLPVDEAQACDVWHRRRLDVTPGLTCIWQVKGRSTVSFADWVRMDRHYIGRRSLIQDLKLLVLTVPAVLLRRGAK